MTLDRHRGNWRTRLDPFLLASTILSQQTCDCFPSEVGQDSKHKMRQYEDILFMRGKEDYERSR